MLTLRYDAPFASHQQFQPWSGFEDQFSDVYGRTNRDRAFERDVDEAHAFEINDPTYGRMTLSTLSATRNENRRGRFAYYYQGADPNVTTYQSSRNNLLLYVEISVWAPETRAWLLDNAPSGYTVLVDDASAPDQPWMECLERLPKFGMVQCGNGHTTMDIVSQDDTHFHFEDDEIPADVLDLGAKLQYPEYQA